jgi:tRNA U34 2-thiouridine synthase MnmA/TrmU
MSGRRAKALGLISGGLDSTLALKIVRDVLGCEVRAITFYTGFCITETQRRRGGRRDGTMPRNEALRAGADLETEIELVDISDQGYLDVITHPKYGYGANANPCVDCRIDMFRRARAILDEWGGDFVFTGEVLGQRPKSQRRDTMWVVERDAGLEGRLLRPLSAKLLAPTIAENEGLIDRENHRAPLPAVRPRQADRRPGRGRERRAGPLRRRTLPPRGGRADGAGGPGRGRTGAGGEAARLGDPRPLRQGPGAARGEDRVEAR